MVSFENWGIFSDIPGYIFRKLNYCPWVLSIMLKIPEISIGIQMEKFVSVSSDRNIRDHLWRWSTYFGRNIPTEINMTNRFFALIWEFGKRI